MPRTLIIGAGHNGLVCAAYLAAAGHHVTVVERAPVPGGCTITEEIFPGFRFNTGAIELEGMVHSGVDRELGLEEHGLTLGPHRASSCRTCRRPHGAVSPRSFGNAGRISAGLWRRSGRGMGKVCRVCEHGHVAVGSLQHVKTPGFGGIAEILDRLGEFGGRYSKA